MPRTRAPGRAARRIEPIEPDELLSVHACEELNRDVRAAIAAASTRITCTRSKVVVAHLEPSRDVYLVLSGRVRVQIDAPGGRQVTLQLLSSGEMFGELAAIDQGPRSASVIAESDCVLARISEGTFLGLLRTQPSFAIAVMRRLVTLARWLQDRVVETRTFGVTGRVCAELIRIATLTGSRTVSVTDEDMATRVGTRREHIARVNRELREACLIERHARHIVVKDVAGLRQRMLADERL